MCKVIDTNADDQGTVRSVTLLVGIDGDKKQDRILVRPITKLVLILESDNIDSLMREPNALSR